MVCIVGDSGSMMLPPKHEVLLMTPVTDSRVEPARNPQAKKEVPLHLVLACRAGGGNYNKG